MAARPWETAYLDECDEKPTTHEDAKRAEGKLEAEEDEELPKKPPPPPSNPALETSQESLLPPQHSKSPEVSLSSSLPENPVEAQQCKALPSGELSAGKPSASASASAATTVSSRLLKPTKSSSSKSTSTAAQEVRSEAMTKGVDDRNTPDGKQDQLLLREALPSEAVPPKNRTGLKRHSFSGPLKVLQEDPTAADSPAIPSYMMVTQSAKAKARSQSNPKLRPELVEEKTSKRRSSLPAQAKANSIPWQTFRSASTKGFRSVRSSAREGGG
jgi:hypothetical protein